MNNLAFQRLRSVALHHPEFLNYALARQVYIRESRPQVLRQLRNWVCGKKDVHGCVCLEMAKHTGPHKMQ